MITTPNSSVPSESQSSRGEGLHIAFVLGNLAVGGAQKTSVLLANWIADKWSIQVTLVVLTGQHEPLIKISDNVRLIRLANVKASSSVLALSRVLRRLQPTHVVSAQNHVNIVSIVAKSISARRSELIIWEKNIFLPLLSRGIRLKDVIVLMVTRAFYPHADRLLVNSPDTLSSLTEARVRLPPSVNVFPNPVETARTKKSLGISALAGKRYLVSVGRLVFQKGFDVLLHAFAALELHGHHLVIVGEGPEREPLENLASNLGIEDRVIFLGWLREPESVVSKSELFVLSSRWEGFGNVLVEALQLGVPIVATNCPGGPAWILDEGTFGTLVPNESATQLAKAIDSVLQSPSRRNRLVRRGNQFRTSRLGNHFVEEFILKKGH